MKDDNLGRRHQEKQQRPLFPADFRLTGVPSYCSVADRIILQDPDLFLLLRAQEN